MWSIANRPADDKAQIGLAQRILPANGPLCVRDRPGRENFFRKSASALRFHALLPETIAGMFTVMHRGTICLTLLASVLLSAPVWGKRLWAKSFLNQKAPDLVVEKWLTPQPDTAGKFVLIDFWATWCPPCRETIPELNQLQHQFGDRLAVIGISDETEAAVRALTQPKIEYAVAIDPQKRMKDQLAVTGIPHVILIDPAGIVRWEGFPLLDGERLTPEVVGDILAKYSQK